MGRKSPGGVYAKGADRIEFVFFYKGKRYRPTVLRTPSAANLRRAQLQLIDIRARIRPVRSISGRSFRTIASSTRSKKFGARRSASKRKLANRMPNAGSHAPDS